MGRKPFEWTPERDAFLRENIGKLSYREMGKILGCSHSNVHIRAIRLSLYNPNSKPIIWTPEKDAYLRENYMRMTQSQLAETLGCSRGYIGNRVRKLGLSKRGMSNPHPWRPPCRRRSGIGADRFRALVTVRNRYGKVDVSKFLQAWRERVRFRRGNNQKTRMLIDLAEPSLKRFINMNGRIKLNHRQGASQSKTRASILPVF